MDRRMFLQATGIGAAAAVVAACHPTSPPSPPFLHGVASGDPLPTAVVLWTRVTPTVEATPGSGRGAPTTVGWQVALDPSFSRIVRSGSVVTGIERDHTVKVDVTGLASATSYWYRFTSAGRHSVVGRTRTAPAWAAAPTSVRFGTVSCSNYEGGHFSPYRHLAARNDLDFVLHLGDYLYEYAPGEYGPGPSIGRTHVPAHEMVTLSDYRQRHGLYKTDPDLAALHARYPFILTWDDHETTNDAWTDGAENHQPAEGSWPARRNAARQAWFEWLPVRPPGPGRIYRSLRFGALAELFMLDLRQYRSQQVTQYDGAAIDDPARTITGDAQMAWLKDGLAATTSRWKLVGNPVMISPVVFPPLPSTISRPLADITGLLPPDGVPYNVDQWDGYTADRRELLDHLATRRIDDAVFLTGDIHSSWACDLPIDAGTYPLTPSVATELVCPSVTSDNLDDITSSPPRTTSVAVESAIRGANRHIKYLEFDSHGYTVVDVEPTRLQMDWFFVSDRTDRHATSRFAQAWTVAAGSNRVTPAAGPLGARR